jgi:hypothetical protein
MYEHHFGKEWFYGIGTVYRIRPSVITEMQKRFDDYWPKMDKSDFNRLNQELQRLSNAYYAKKRST